MGLIKAYLELLESAVVVVDVVDDIVVIALVIVVVALHIVADPIIKSCWQ